LNCTNEKITREEVNKLKLATDNERKTVFHVAADCGEIIIFMTNTELGSRGFNASILEIRILTEYMGLG
jgi:hypothetical protein